jgi:gluconokinase
MPLSSIARSKLDLLISCDFLGSFPCEMPSHVQCVVMGVSGIGKTTISGALAASLPAEAIDADNLHPPENVRKMQAGIPLQDEDRWGWLDRVAAVLQTWEERGLSGVIACSALKRRYRDLLRRGCPSVCFIYLRAPRDIVASRLAARQGHYMPVGLLDSQFAALEEPEADECVCEVDATLSPSEVVAAGLEYLRAKLSTIPAESVNSVGGTTAEAP